MRTMSLALFGVLLATAALAEGAPPPPPAPSGPMAAAEPPPPGSRPPPPPPGAAVMLDRGQNGTVHVDVHCARADTTRDCADIAARLLAETGAK